MPVVVVGVGAECGVCGAALGDTLSQSGHVARCARCAEDTPVRPAPPGKTFVRCPCNCLLVAKEDSKDIVCPRPACKRVINLCDLPKPLGPAVACAHCGFKEPLGDFELLDCVKCGGLSSVGLGEWRRRTLVHAVLFALALGVAGAVAAGTVGPAQSSPALYGLWALLFLLAGLLLLRLIFLALMKVSHVVPSEEPV